MKAFFQRLPLPTKLTLLGGLPLIFLLIISFQLNRSRTEKLGVLDNYRQRIDQSIKINSIIDNLQVERRYAFGFALQGTWHNEMLIQRGKTDEVIKRMQEGTTSSLPGFTTYTFLDQLKNFRLTLDRKEADPLQIMNFYTNAIFRLGTLNHVAVGNVAFLRPVIKDLTGQKILSDIITYKGIVRAQIYLMLHTGQINPQLVASVIQLEEITETYINEFIIKASPNAVEEFKSLHKDTDYRLTADYLNNIRKTKSLDSTIDAEHWWEVSANAVDRLRDMQQKLINNVRQGTDELYSNEKRQQQLELLLLIIILLIVIGLIYYIIRSISQTLSSLRTSAQAIAIGKTGIPLKQESRDVIGALTQSIIEIDIASQQMAATADAIGKGNFDVVVHPRSDEDVLGNAIVRMKDNLQELTQSNEEKIWIQSGVGIVNDAIRGEKDIASLSRDALQRVVEYLQCETGLLYVSKENVLHYEAGYAISNQQLVPQNIPFGETVIGQAVLKQEVLHLQNVPDDFLKIRSAAGASSPKHVLIIPLVNNNEIEGVIEVATLYEVEEHKIAFAREIASDIAIALQAAKSRARLQELFEETQAQAEELQSQHRELEALNAELEMNTQRLQASEEELKVQQEELMQANQELEERSRLLEERNQVILERNLEIQRKAEELEISTKYKSEFLANMSHELRTPLNSILLLSRLLAENNEKNLTKDQIEYAEVIQSSGSGLLSLIDEILDLSKIEAGKMDLEYAQVGVREITSGLQSLFSPIARDKNLEFRIHIEENTPALIETDRMRLEQVLKNLLSNAFKFTSKGFVELSISPLPSNQAFLAFSVRDSGIGIPKDKQQAVFEAFQQADGSTKRKFGGTGLGLSISRELVKILGGEIKLTSEPGQGSEFTIYLPVHKPDETQVNVANTNEQPQSATSSINEEKKQEEPKRFLSSVIPQNLPDDRNNITSTDRIILIIEDDVNFAKALLDYTRSKGYKGIIAVRGDEGIELATQFKPLGILLDIQLPVKDGWEVMEELKSNPATRPIPVHIMSSHSVKRESLMKGAIDFINKPVAFEQMQEIFQKIEQVLSKTHKKVLIIEENSRHAKALAYFLETFNVTSEVSQSITQSVDALEKEEVDCVILDMGVPDATAYETLEEIKKKSGLENLPVIVFTGKSLSTVEESKLKQYADSIVVKTAHSYQRILDEVSLFLHIIGENNQTEKKSKYAQLGGLDEVLRNKKILVTDDDVRNIFSLTKALEKHQMDVFSAVDGKEALRILEEQPDIDVVLMDIMMPQMDGYETMRRIRNNPKYRNLPIIAVTAKAMTGDREKCIQAGASDYISKPVDIDQLLSLLRVWLYDNLS